MKKNIKEGKSFQDLLYTDIDIDTTKLQGEKSFTSSIFNGNFKKYTQDRM